VPRGHDGGEFTRESGIGVGNFSFGGFNLVDFDLGNYNLGDFNLNGVTLAESETYVAISAGLAISGLRWRTGGLRSALANLPYDNSPSAD
jgi:hypothetical protein